MNEISEIQPREALVQSTRRYFRQRAALLELTSAGPPAMANPEAAFQRILTISAPALEVDRASIWRLIRNGDALECVAVTGREAAGLGVGSLLEKSAFPAHLEAVLQDDILAVDAARTDPATSELTAAYLRPLDVRSLLDVPVRDRNLGFHLLRFEICGTARPWTEDEKSFAAAVGNQVALALESASRAAAVEEVEWSQQRFQAVSSVTSDTVWDWDLKTDSFWWNDGFARLFGWPVPPHEATIQAWIRQIHPDDRERVVTCIYAAIEGGATLWTDKYRFVSNEDRISHVLDRGKIIRDSDGKAVRMVGGMSDRTAGISAESALERSHRALRMLNSCNEMLIRATDETELLAEACRVAVEIGGYRMAWVGFAMHDERKRVRPMAHAGAELGYLGEIEVSWAEDHSTGIGPVGQAIRSGQPIVFEDVLETPSFSYWLSPARKRGYRSVICLPLRILDTSLGAICLYGSEPHNASAQELDMLRRMANDLSFGIATIRSREERERTQEIVVKVARAVSTGVGSEFFDLLTSNMVEALGAHGGLIGRFRRAEHSIDTISFVSQGELMPNTSYGLGGTPCAEVMKGRICVFESGVSQLFPDDHLLQEFGIEAYAGLPLMDSGSEVLGIMVVFFAHELKNSALVRSTLQIFAARAAAEMDRQQSDSRIREQASLLDKAKDAIVVRGLDHRISYWNKSAERLYGWAAEEAVGKSAEALLYRDSAAFHRAHAGTLDDGEWIGEMRQIHKSGRELTIEGRWTLVRGPDNQPESVFALNTDISEHRKLEQQFLRAQRMESIGTLAGGIAHDLNNILAPISMAIELLKMRVTDGRSTELLETIATSARRGAEMVGQVLSFARGMEGRRVEVHPRQLILEIEKILRDTLLKKIEVTVRASRDSWVVHGDPTQLNQVLLNLCVNARDAVGPDGKITIAADNVEIDASFAAVNLEAQEGPHVRFEVTDNGTGIQPEILDRIFEPFFTTKSIGKGTGLGLSTSLAIVKSHGGFFRALSLPGEGTTFFVYLPARPERAGWKGAIPAPELPHGAGQTVLVIDDEQSIRDVTGQTLESFGYHVLTAANGRIGLTAFEKNRDRIAVVLTDMMMPVMDGSETIARLFEIDPSVRIVATSGIDTNRDLADKAGPVKAFLAKPYTAGALIVCLDQVLSETVPGS